MRRAIIAAVLLGTVGGVVWTHHETLGLDEAWPVAIGFALAALGASRLGATAVSAAVGIAVGWALFLVVTLFLPFIPLSFGIAAGAAIALLALLSAGIARASLAASLVGFASYFAVYERLWIDDRPGFLGQSSSAAVTLAFALFGGMAIFAVLDVLAGTVRAAREEPTEPIALPPALPGEPPAEIDIRERVIDIEAPQPEGSSAAEDTADAASEVPPEEAPR